MSTHTIGKTLPLIMGSDNHDITRYEIKASGWIKGDPSFRTFQQLISDPQRAFLGETPVETVRIDGNPTKYVSEVQFLKNAGSTLDEDWFSGTLIFYLLIDRRDVPLIIDQPEDNLDNPTVYDMLVACLREARKRRQVIIVTHNPNLAVVSDADQIIHSHIDKQHKNKVTYTTGSLENPKTNALSIRPVLEGTRPAFVLRDRKYHEEA
jgi:hypothetical protein